MAEIVESSPGLNYPEYGKRLFAFLIDGLLGIVLSVLLLFYLVLPVVVPDLQERMQGLHELMTTPDSTVAEQDMEAQMEHMMEVVGPLITPVNLGLFTLLVLYYSLSEILTKGASLGKQLFRLRVYSLRTRQPVTAQVSITRALIKTGCIVLFPHGLFGMIFLLGIVMLPMFTRYRQALHDLPVRTTVMDESALWVRVETPSHPPQTPNT